MANDIRIPKMDPPMDDCQLGSAHDHFLFKAASAPVNRVNGAEP